jgi:hypothetical protein
MSTYFLLELDTTAPEVTFGDPEFDGPTLVLPYALSEPGTIEAVLYTTGGESVTMITTPTELVAVPPIMGRGVVTIRARARDDVWNEEDNWIEVALLGEEPGRRYARVRRHVAVPRFADHDANAKVRAHKARVVIK